MIPYIGKIPTKPDIKELNNNYYLAAIAASAFIPFIANIIVAIPEHQLPLLFSDKKDAVREWKAIKKFYSARNKSSLDSIRGKVVTGATGIYYPTDVAIRDIKRKQKQRLCKSMDIARNTSLHNMIPSVGAMTLSAAGTITAKELIAILSTILVGLLVDDISMNQKRSLTREEMWELEAISQQKADEIVREIAINSDYVPFPIRIKVGDIEVKIREAQLKEQLKDFDWDEFAKRCDFADWNSISNNKKKEKSESILKIKGKGQTKEKGKTGSGGKDPNNWNRRDKYLKIAKNSMLINAINQLFRPGAYTGDGGTADILIHEFLNGRPLKHLQKARDMIDYLNRIIATQFLYDDEKKLAYQLLNELYDAVKRVTSK